jgi:hypothetical protein
MVPEYSSPFPSVTQWFLPCQLLGNLSTDASGAWPSTCLVMKTRKSEDFMGGQILCLSTREECYRWVSDEFDMKALEIYNHIGAPKFILTDGWTIYCQMLPYFD